MTTAARVSPIPARLYGDKRIRRVFDLLDQWAEAEHGRVDRQHQAFAAMVELVVGERAAELPSGDLTSGEAARLLRCSRQQVSKMALSGKLPGAYRLGTEWRIPPRAISALKEADA